MKNHMQNASRKIVAFYQGLISGMWIVNFMRQVIVTGGNIAESTFLLATLWVIVNAVAHTLLTWIIPTHTIELINYLSVIAFSALPELIFIPVVILCYSHWSVAIKRKSFVSGTWAVLYSIPAAFFLVMTIMAITTFVSTGGTHFVPADGIQLVIRCLSGWMYAVVNMLFQRLGEPHYASQFEALETVIDSQRDEMARTKSHFEHALQTANSNFQIAMQSKQAEFDYRVNEILEQGKNKIEHLQMLLQTQNAQVQKLSEKASSLERHGIENYPKVISELVEKQVKTVLVDEAVALTGHSKRRINNAKSLQRHSRNKDLIIVSSLIEWLKTVPLPETQISSNGHLIDDESDTDPLGLPVLTITALED